MYFAIVNGPNLNWLGKRDPQQYGGETWQEIFEYLQEKFKHHQLGVELKEYQNNIEGQLINILQELENDTNCLGVVINGGGYSHTSVALADCVEAMNKPVVSIHMSNTHSREEERQRDLLGAAANGTIIGFGKESYWWGLQALHSLV